MSEIKSKLKDDILNIKKEHFDFVNILSELSINEKSDKVLNEKIKNIA